MVWNQFKLSILLWKTMALLHEAKLSSVATLVNSSDPVMHPSIPLTVPL